MDRRERLNDPEETFRTAFEGLAAGLWTSLPGIVYDYNASAQTVSVRPAIQGRVTDTKGNTSLVDLPLLLDCPVQFPSGGGFTSTFPVAEGDEVLVVFASRCIDAWWQNSGVQAPLELRMHDLSDGFAVVGFRSKPRVLSNVSTTAAQLRTDDGSTFVEINASGCKVHAGTVYEWDCHGYGEKWTWTGGADWTHDVYSIGANVTTNNHNIAPPGPL